MTGTERSLFVDASRVRAIASAPPRSSDAESGRARRRSRRSGAVRIIARDLPIAWDETGQQWRPQRRPIGAALSTLPRRAISEWIGAAYTLGTPPTDASAPPALAPMRPVRAPVSVVAGADNMANGVLRPALHGMDEHARYRSAYWEAFVAFNDTVSRSAVRSCRFDDRVWIHDHHLLLCPTFIKSARRDVTVGLSLYTPFDARSMSRLAHASAIAASLSRCDVVGVQTLVDVDQLECFLADQHAGRPGRIVVSPSSIDPDQVVAEAVDSDFSAQVRQRAGARTVAVAVDRLDHARAIVERLVACDVAFREGAVDPDDVHIVQIVDASTGNAQPEPLRVELERLIHQLRVDWCRSDGTSPIELHLAPLERADVLSVLAHADVALVTPRRDGMDLVAKQFSILTEHTPGALVLSTGSGAACELGPGSVLVDGGDPHSVADGFARSLALDASDAQLMAACRARAVRAWTSEHWANSFLDQIGSPVPVSDDAVCCGTADDVREMPRMHG